MRKICLILILLNIFVGLSSFAIEDYFAILDVPRNNVSSVILDQAFRREMDGAPSDRLEVIALAYATLKDPARRAAYLTELTKYEAEQNAPETRELIQAELAEQYGLRPSQRADIKVNLFKMFSAEWAAFNHRLSEIRAAEGFKDGETVFSEFFPYFIKDQRLVAMIELALLRTPDFFLALPSTAEIQQWIREINFYERAGVRRFGLYRQEIRSKMDQQIELEKINAYRYLIKNAKADDEATFVEAWVNLVTVNRVGSTTMQKEMLGIIRTYQILYQKNAHQLWNYVMNDLPRGIEMEQVAKISAAMGHFVSGEQRLRTYRDKIMASAPNLDTKTMVYATRKSFLELIREAMLLDPQVGAELARYGRTRTKVKGWFDEKLRCQHAIALAVTEGELPEAKNKKAPASSRKRP